MLGTSPKGTGERVARLDSIKDKDDAEREGGVNEKPAGTHNKSDMPLSAGDSIIQFGIFCCAIAMVVVLAVALAAS